MTESSSNPVPENKSDRAVPSKAAQAQTSAPASSPEPSDEIENEVMSPADLLAEVAAEIFPPEPPEIEVAEVVSEPETLHQPNDAGEPAFPPGSIEQTVLAPESETDAIAAEPDLDAALEAASEGESIEAARSGGEVEELIEAAAQESLSPKPALKGELTPASVQRPSAITPTKLAPAAHEAIKREDGPENSPFNIFVSQVYEGPMDLLLDLIRRQDIDIYDIPIAKITAQFLAYVNHLRASDMDVAGEFIYTASLLIHIKSKMLLPREPSGVDDGQDDPRRELVERLLEHERFKNAAQMLQQKQMLEAATWSNPGVREFLDDSSAEPEIAADTVDLVRIFRDILERARNRPILDVEEDTVTVGQMIQFLARRLTLEDKPVALRRLLGQTKSERALIAMFLALLELVRLQAILLRQDLHFSEIFIKKSSGFETVLNQGQIRDDWQ